MDEQLRLGVGVGLAAQLGRADPGVHVALAHPDVHVGAAGRPLHVGAEELIRQEEDLLVRRQGRHDLRGVGRGAAQVGLRLDLGAGVHVRDDRGARVLGLPLAQLRRGDGVGQRAAGPRLRDQHGPVGGEDLGRLGHEVHPGEHDDAGRARRGEAREGERVADVVGDVLDLGRLVIVREDDGVALGRQPPDLRCPVRAGRVPVAPGRIVPGRIAPGGVGPGGVGPVRVGPGRVGPVRVGPVPRRARSASARSASARSASAWSAPARVLFIACPHRQRF